MKHFLVLLILAILSQAIWFTIGYSKHWWGAGQTNYDIENASYLLLILPLVWIMWVNGKEKFLIRLFLYTSFFITYFSAYFFISSISNFNISHDGIIRKNSILFSHLIWILETLLILTIGNYIIARIERTKLTCKNKKYE